MPDLIPGYSYKVMTRDELTPFFERYRHVVFAETHPLDSHYAHSETEQAAISALARNLAGRYTLGFGLFREDTFVGWHLGQQVLAGKFEMTSTGILREHRRLGLYSALLPVVLETVRKEGFQIVYSRHNLTNNAVIIPNSRRVL
jgi:GNAT superfamily N-acetyltransferase